ncbi:DUF2917 domain-containing protein [Caenimonas aquaedulcis]|uniref:DUF2917 domain-containing protein n=1 Tax=Caenimonas aquaedulcis TaxID=2793270 RepID=A0A931H6P5_9BURK|nr:DUF2917 domain-containing protein [Caenimonas aquaedulcis]MBG9389661.1 DUF2917 domain-containing protein [Caenimonas aquaedulcis]
MAFQTFPQTQQSSDSPVLPGTWKLVPGRAITLEPREAGTLKVAHGQLWVTYEGPHEGALNESGDLFIGVGNEVVLRAGQRLVVEAWNDHAPSYFSWDPLPEPVRAPRMVRVMQPLADLRVALAMTARALGGLAAGLGGLALDLVTPRPRETCPAHGAAS